MNLLKGWALSILVVALFPFVTLLFAQSGSTSNNDQTRYTASSPDDCCIYQPPATELQNPNGMHIFIFSGLKSHGPGQHDYPQFLADWSKFLTLHGAVVDGALHAPSAADLAHTDVVLIFKGDAGFMTPQEHAAFLAYVKRGGGLVSIHDSLCGPDPSDMAMFVGGGKKHGQVNFTLGAPLTYNIVDPSSPIMQGVPNGLTIYDEAFYRMTWATDPKIHPLATVKIPDTPSAVRGGGVGQVVPQIWTYDHTLPGGQPARAFVWMQGHFYENFSNPIIQNMLLRGIAWAGKQPVNSLVDYKPHINPRFADFVGLIPAFAQMRGQ
jgi:type 1 glutamine amidotransferase